eukprot:snap_masked-scaffold_22-processed-gene-0.43-mRNA-1 protein AED:1.00 eAED:1.00 QI:0/-1/0/0/-1/1/1/0/265
MKFQYFIAFIPMVVSKLGSRELIAEQIITSLGSMVTQNPALSSMKQTCEFVEEYEEVLECLSPFSEFFSDIISELTADELSEFLEIVFGYELSVEEKNEQLVELLGEPGLCTSEFFDTISKLAFCGFSCEETFCEENTDLVIELLGTSVELFGCQLETDNICEIFNEVTVTEEENVDEDTEEEIEYEESEYEETDEQDEEVDEDTEEDTEYEYVDIEYEYVDIEYEVDDDGDEEYENNGAAAGLVTVGMNVVLACIVALVHVVAN